ncbi:MAG: DUF5763 domain-containing protein [Chitinophagaceae bacterium]|nr:DUF5763 domain-containing protein [Chitinophagaceae bacterium]
MLLDHADYTKLVTSLFQQKLANRELPRFITNSSPARLKHSFEDICRNGISKKDEPLLYHFFGQPTARHSLLEIVETTSTERFRTLNKYLNGKTENTDARNIELLAVLVDFRHRPYSLGMNVQLSEDELTLLGKCRFVSPVKNGKEEEEVIVEKTIKEKEELNLEPLQEVKEKKEVDKEKSKWGIFIKILNRYLSKAAATYVLLLLLSISSFYIYQNSEGSGAIAYRSDKNENPVEQNQPNENNPAPVNQASSKTVAPPVKKYRVLPEERCQATTKKGTQCKRKAQADGYCWQHPLE